LAASHAWEKELQKAVKTQHQFGWSVRDKRGKVCVQRFFKDTNKKYAATLDIPWESGQTLAVLSALRKINDVMVSSGLNLKEAVKLFSTKNEEAEINWNEAITKFKKHKLESGGCSESTWNSNYKNVVERITADLNSKNAPQSGLGILEKIKYEKDGQISFGKGRRRRILSAKQFLNYAVHDCGADERWLPPANLETIKELKGKQNKKDKPAANNSGKAERIADDAFLELLDSFDIAKPDQKRWRLAIGLVGCFALRPVELKYCKPNGDLLDIDYIKVSSDGATEARQVEPLPPVARPELAKQLLLELSTGLTELPPLGSVDRYTARSLSRALDRNVFWNKLKAEAIEAGTKISCYSLRHGAAYRGAVVYGIGVDDLAKNMGHSVSTHLKYYRDFHDKKGKASRFEAARKSVLLS
jgi:integrase